MKCSHPECNRGIGLVSYRRGSGWGRYCSKKCRDSYVIERTKAIIPEPAAATYVEWLFLQPVSNALSQMARGIARVRRR